MRFAFDEGYGMLAARVRPNEQPTNLVIPMTDGMLSPVKEYCSVHGLGLTDEVETIFHRERILNGKRHCNLKKEVGGRWMQDTFKRIVREAQVDAPYSITSLRNLFAQVVGQVPGTSPGFVRYMLGYGRYSPQFQGLPGTGALKKRIAVHFDRTLRKMGVL